MLDLESEVNQRGGGNILLLDFVFYVVKPLMPLLTLLTMLCLCKKKNSNSWVWEGN